MVFAISKRACVRNVQMMLVLGLIWLVPLGAAAQSSPTIEVCNHCNTDWQFSQAALSASNPIPDQWKDVYVVNIKTEQTRAYRVIMFMDDFDDFGNIVFDVNVTGISGNPGVLGDIAEAITVVKDFEDELIQNVPAEELNLPFDSAIDLVGPDSGITQFNRDAIQNELTQRYRTFLRARLFESMDIASSLVNRFFANLTITIDNVVVVFEDGSQVTLDIENVGAELESNLLTVKFEVDETSVIVPGILSAVP